MCLKIWYDGESWKFLGTKRGLGGSLDLRRGGKSFARRAVHESWHWHTRRRPLPSTEGVGSGNCGGVAPWQDKA
jgi:hypothetical protein